MYRTRQIANRLREVLLEGFWVANTNFKHQLSQCTWEQATLRIGKLNSIAMLTYHINYYLAGLLEVFGGKPLSIRDQYSFDLPAIQSEADWLQLKGSF